jgi:Zn-finger nucleic acid-binding protein
MTQPPKNVVQKPASRELFCPQCQQKTAKITPFSHVQVDFCHLCGLVWLDQGELGQLIGRRQDLPPVAQPSPLVQDPKLCPRCLEESLVPWIAETVGFFRCQKCSGILIPLRETAKIKKLFPVLRSLPKSVPVEVKDSAALGQGPQVVMSLETPRFDLVALPLAVVMGFIMEKIHLLSLIAWYFSMLVHEFSHGLVAWLSGFPSLPLPFGFTFIAEERHLWATAWGFILWSGGMTAALILRSFIIGVHFGVLFLMQIYFSLFLSQHQAQAMVIAGGVAGEILFAGWLLGAFHYKPTEKLRWDFWRFPCFILGLFLFNKGILRWMYIYLEHKEIPWGTVMGGNNHGDMSRLRDVWHWRPEEIKNRYFVLCVAAVLWIILHYVIFLGLNLKKKYQRSFSKRSQLL